MGILRFILAASVVLWHSYNEGYSIDWLPFNSVACVLLFFIISGFYMTLVLNEKYSLKQNVLFWQNRFFRLWPSFIFATILIGIFAHPDLIFKTYNETSLPTFLILLNQLQWRQILFKHTGRWGGGSGVCDISAIVLPSTEWRVQE